MMYNNKEGGFYGGRSKKLTSPSRDHEGN